MPTLRTRTTAAPDVYELLTADLSATERGGMVLHTSRASIAIDESGICRDAFTLDGTELTDVERCIGAQYNGALAAMNPSLRLAIHVLFLLSGATALVYQVTWLRNLSLVFGASFEATSIVLAAFMAGLSAGGFVFARRAERLVLSG